MLQFLKVIVDEASQSDIQALPALLRGKKLLIVGDAKQVSPTEAFVSEEKITHLRTMLQNQVYSELMLPGRSLFDLSRAVFPGSRIVLTEHFRCARYNNCLRIMSLFNLLMCIQTYHCILEC